MQVKTLLDREHIPMVIFEGQISWRGECPSRRPTHRFAAVRAPFADTIGVC